LHTHTIYNAQNFKQLCDIVAATDADVKNIITTYGYPPMWVRPATYQTLVLIILEQQISLASAYAAFKKLQQKIGTVTPKKLLALTDDEMRACYFTRQKMGYARLLAQAILNKQLVLKTLATLTDDEARAQLKKIKALAIEVWMFI
jgi:DNA-3-methyladenine glycosylase II